MAIRMVNSVPAGQSFFGSNRRVLSSVHFHDPSMAGFIPTPTAALPTASTGAAEAENTNRTGWMCSLPSTTTVSPGAATFASTTRWTLNSLGLGRCASHHAHVCQPATPSRTKPSAPPMAAFGCRPHQPATPRPRAPSQAGGW